MRLTRRGQAAVGCALALAAGALLLDARPLFVGAAVVGASVVGAQLAFVRTLSLARAATTVSVTAPTPRPAVDEETALELAVETTAGLPLRVRLTPPAATDAARPLTVDVDDDGEGSTELPLRWTVAGRFGTDPPEVLATDPQGLFEATYELAPAEENTVEVTVQPREPDTAPYAEGRLRSTPFGDHDAGLLGQGIDPGELRPYAPGDDVRRIDWNATARLDGTYVVDSQAKTDRETVLLVDHRASTALGPGDATVLSHLRHAALAVLENARMLDDPVGLYAVGDDGVSVAMAPRTGGNHYDTVADELRELVPTTAPPGRAYVAPSWSAAVAATSGGPADGTDETTAGHDGTGAEAGLRPSTPTAASAPAQANRARERLAADTSPFARQLAPLLEDVEPYVHRVAEDPLFAAARTYVGRLHDPSWAVIVTDDAHRVELREAVKLARQGDTHVLVILAPRIRAQGSVTGDDWSSAGAETTDEQERPRSYADVTEFKRRLTALDRVQVLEIGPDDAVEAVLERGGART